MANIPARVETRIKEGLKRFQPVVEQAKARDIGEADTSTLVKDILAELFGYDKYNEITAEFQIKGTYCDLALKIDGKLALLIEVKAINSELREAYVKQAVDYAANQGIEWVVLTNAQAWQIYKVCFAQPISNELLMTIPFSTVSPKNENDVQSLFLLTREAQGKSLLDDYHQQKQALSRFCVGAVVLSDPVVSVIRREVLEGDRTTDATRKVSKAANKALRSRGGFEPPPSTALAPAAVSPTSADANALPPNNVGVIN